MRFWSYLLIFFTSSLSITTNATIINCSALLLQNQQVEETKAEIKDGFNPKSLFKAIFPTDSPYKPEDYESLIPIFNTLTPDFFSSTVQSKDELMARLEQIDPEISSIVARVVTDKNLKLLTVRHLNLTEHKRISKKAGYKVPYFSSRNFETGSSFVSEDSARSGIALRNPNVYAFLAFKQLPPGISLDFSFLDAGRWGRERFGSNLFEIDYSKVKRKTSTSIGDSFGLGNSGFTEVIQKSREFYIKMHDLPKDYFSLDTRESTDRSHELIPLTQMWLFNYLFQLKVENAGQLPDEIKINFPIDTWIEVNIKQKLVIGKAVKKHQGSRATISNPPVFSTEN